MTSHPLLYVRVSDAPAMFSIGRSTIYDAGKRGEIRIYKRGATALLKVSEVVEWIEGRGAACGADAAPDTQGTEN